MTRHLLVTTPMRESATAAEEARGCIEAGGGFYFRRFVNCPKGLEAGSRIYYVEAGYIRGYATVDRVMTLESGERCGTTGRLYPPGTYAFMPAETWKWVRPLAYKGFQGFRYIDPTGLGLRVVGGWRSPKPEVTP